MTLAEMRARMKALANELGALAQKESRSQDEEGQLDTLLAEFNELGPKLEREERAQKSASDAATLAESRGRQVPGTQAQPQSQESTIDMRSIGRQFTESQSFQDYLSRGGKRSAPAFADGVSFYPEHRNRAALAQHREGMGPDELRAVIQTGNLPADYIRPQVVPGFFRGEDLQGSLRDVLINGTTESDAIVFFRETAYTNNAAGVSQATHTSGADETPVNASVKPESALTFEQVTAPVVTVAHWIPITRQTLQDAAQMQAYVEQRLLDGLRTEESSQLLNGTGGNDLTGLLQTANVQNLDQTYFSGAAVNDAGQDNENFNRILRARRLVRTVGRARANFVVINPADLENFLTYTDGDRQYFGAGPFSGTGLTQMWGLRVVEDENLAAGAVLVGDGRMAAVWDRMQSQIFIDTIDDQFVRNMLTILAEERVALTVFRPQAFALVDLA